MKKILLLLISTVFFSCETKIVEVNKESGFDYGREAKYVLGSDDNAQIICIIDNQEFKHKIIKYQKVNGNCNRFIIDEASSSLIYKFHKKEQFVF